MGYLEVRASVCVNNTSSVSYGERMFDTLGFGVFLFETLCSLFFPDVFLDVYSLIIGV